MIYLINLNKEDYLSGKIPNEEAIDSSITMDGKFTTKKIAFSIEHEEDIKGKPN